MIRGRGGRGGRGRRSGPYNNWPSRPPHQSFDLWKASEIFPNVRAANKDNASNLAKAIVERHGQLLPPAAETTANSDLLGKVSTILDNFIVMQTGKEKHALEEVRPVGSHKLGVNVAGEKEIEIVVIFKQWPTCEDVQTIAEHVKTELIQTAPGLELSITESGFTLSLNGTKCVCHAATLPDSWTEPNFPGQVKMQAIEFGLAQIRHTRWFEDNVSHTSTRMLCRILTDIAKRFTGFRQLTPWMVQLLAHQSSMVPGQRDALPIADSLRRSLQFLASGFFLAKNLGIVDPCEPNCYRVHQHLENNRQDVLCCAAQTLLRWLSHGAEKQVLGLGVSKAADISMTVKCRGVIVEPSRTVAEAGGTNTSSEKAGDEAAPAPAIAVPAAAKA
ncbi:interleukin enhancer-binding factor 2 homolog [Sycon ciliatum]|uniref:interleukin enhancer-binding factor 2 homolog n=1 Tax=Sycon ciliatum TaxID=27933 RepID=UPI0031F66831|eukprot:scpid76344/ scgid13037/ Interleukin enhancer-binding factor 2 homolog